MLQRRGLVGGPQQCTGSPGRALIDPSSSARSHKPIDQHRLDGYRKFGPARQVSPR